MIQNKLGSSETTREAPHFFENQPLRFFDSKKRHLIGFDFDFQNFLCPEHKKFLNISFLEWLIGFTEGDHCFIVEENQGKLKLRFEINKTDPKLLYKIRTELGFGRVLLGDNQQNCWKYTVCDKKGIQRLISLFSGNLIIPKRIAQFEKWVETAVNTSICTSNFIQNVRPVSEPVSICLQTAWFSGFLEAKGCFYVRYWHAAAGHSSGYLEQKVQLINPDFKANSEIFQNISILFDKSLIPQIKQNVEYFEICSTESQKILIDYLQRFPFQGVKKIIFQRWYRVYLYRVERRLEQDLLTEKSLRKLIRLCHAINKKKIRTKNEVDDIVQKTKRNS
jgi:hypothetical protein